MFSLAWSESQLKKKEYNFCQNESKCGQTQDWYLDEKNGGGTRLFE